MHYTGTSTGDGGLDLLRRKMIYGLRTNQQGGHRNKRQYTTLIVQTTLTKASHSLLDHAPGSTDSQELCSEMGGFVWANENRHFGLQNIEIIGVQGEVLSSRTGLPERCTP
jgi:hypothetical protein